MLTFRHIYFSVFEILLRVSEGKTWQEAFLQVLPERKNAQPIVPLENEKQTLLHINNEVEEKMEINELESTNNVYT